MTDRETDRRTDLTDRIEIASTVRAEHYVLTRVKSKIKPKSEAVLGLLTQFQTARDVGRLDKTKTKL